MRMGTLLQNKKGSALIFVIVVLLVTTMLVAAAVFLTQSNTAQAVSQERGIQTYYMARSGAELAYEVLLSTPTLYSQFSNVAYTRNENPVDLGEGSANITVSTVAGSSPQRIRIVSVGWLDGSTLERTAILEFDYLNHNDITWNQ